MLSALPVRMIFTDLATHLYRMQPARRDARTADCWDLRQASVV